MCLLVKRRPFRLGGKGHLKEPFQNSSRGDADVKMNTIPTLGFWCSVMLLHNNRSLTILDFLGRPVIYLKLPALISLQKLCSSLREQNVWCSRVINDGLPFQPWLVFLLRCFSPLLLHWVDIHCCSHISVLVWEGCEPISYICCSDVQRCCCGYKQAVQDQDHRGPDLPTKITTKIQSFTSENSGWIFERYYRN